MDRPDPSDVQIEALVEPSDINPDDRSGSGLLLIAPWEFTLTGVRGEDGARSPYWCCPRCLHTGFLGHAVDIEGDGIRISCQSDEDLDGRDYLQVDDEQLNRLKNATDLQVTVDPSIGCVCCGFHCFLESNTYRVLSDWDAGETPSGDPSDVFADRLQKLQEHRPDAYQRLAEIVEGDR